MDQVTRTAAERIAAYPLPFLTTRAVARALGVTPSAVYKRRERRNIPVAKVGSRLVFLRSVVRQWAENKGL